MTTLLPFQPVGPVVVVLPKKAEQPKTASGIHLADVGDEPETSGMIVAVGSGFRCSACECQREVEYKVGDLVVFRQSAGDIIPFGAEGQECLLLHESDLLAVVNPDLVCEVV